MRNSNKVIISLSELIIHMEPSLKLLPLIISLILSTTDSNSNSNNNSSNFKVSTLSDFSTAITVMDIFWTQITLIDIINNHNSSNRLQLFNKILNRRLRQPKEATISLCIHRRVSIMVITITIKSTYHHCQLRYQHQLSRLSLSHQPYSSHHTRRFQVWTCISKPHQIKLLTNHPSLLKTSIRCSLSNRPLFIKVIINQNIVLSLHNWLLLWITWVIFPKVNLWIPWRIFIPNYKKRLQIIFRKFSNMFFIRQPWLSNLLSLRFTTKENLDNNRCSSK